MNTIQKLLLVSIAINGVCVLTHAHAAKYILSVSGKVNQISALQNSVAVSIPSGIVSIGDDYVLEAQFDTGTAELTALFDADPTVNIYYLPGTEVKARIGSYSTTFVPRFSMNASFQLWDDRIVTGPTDSQSFEFFNYDLSPVAQRPFSMGMGLTSELIQFQAFDFTANARSSDSISELAPVTAFSSQSFGYGILNSETNLFVYVGARITNVSIAAVPEPTTWTMIIIGFGTIGATMRRHRKRSFAFAN